MGKSRWSQAGITALGLVTLAGLTSCTTGTKTSSGADPNASGVALKGSSTSDPGTGLNQLASERNSKPAGPFAGKPTSAEIAAMADENARLMREIRESKPTPEGITPSGSRQAPNNTPAHSSPGLASSPSSGLSSLAPDVATSVAAEPSATSTTTDLAGSPSPASAGSAPDPESKVSAAADELVRTLRDRAGAGKAPLRDYLALAWLDAVRPGSLGDLESGPAATRIDPNQARSISLARDFAQVLYTSPEALRDPERVWSALQRAAEPVLAARDLSIAAAELCTRVDGYGQYAPISSRTFQGGIAHSIVVYTEVENFAHRAATDPSSGGERFAVDLGVAVEVWQDADKPTLQKRWSEAGVTETSRRKRRDFFVTNLIELPKALSVGAYTLKIIVNDRVKSAVAEKVIPFTIVADATTSQPSR